MAVGTLFTLCLCGTAPYRDDIILFSYDQNTFLWAVRETQSDVMFVSIIIVIIIIWQPFFIN